MSGLGGRESACNNKRPGFNVFQEDPLEKGMATHSSSLAWKTPWTEEVGRDVSFKTIPSLSFWQ